MMKLGTVIPYLKNSKNYMNHVTHPLSSVDISIFLTELGKFCYMKKYRCRFHLNTYFLTLLTFLESLRIVLKNVVKILMMSAKMATLGLLRIKIFLKKLMASSFLPMTSPTQFYPVIQIIM